MGHHSRAIIGVVLVGLLSLLVPGCASNSGTAVSPPQKALVSYDIVYVRYPRDGDVNTIETRIELPMGEVPDKIEPGADLVLLHPDGSENILVGCRDQDGIDSSAAEAGDVDVHQVPASAWPNCAVMDPTVSYDGRWVYYSRFESVAGNFRRLRSGAFLFKMEIGGAAPAFQPIQLTDASSGFMHDRYAGHDPVRDEVPFGLRDFAPLPLPGGDLLFVSNRVGLVPPRQGDLGNVSEPWSPLVTQLFRMSDHDGSQPNKNLRAVGHSQLHLAQHPFILKDGRILFSNWDDAGVKEKYALLTLYASNPDGSNLQMFMEPHDFRRRLDHFGTQLANGEVVVASYYPGNNWGFGQLLRMPSSRPGPDFQQDQLKQEGHFRPYARIGTVSMTPHTDGADEAAVNNSGRYSMPAAAPDNAMLVAYSPGPVIGGGPRGLKTPVLDAGIYLVPDATTAVITDPTDPATLVKVHDSAHFNEIWPRAVVPYADTFGVPMPAVIADEANLGDKDAARLPEGTPFALFGTSSIYNRESAPLNGGKFQNGNIRAFSNGNWTVQGAQAGLFTNADIWGVRILASAPKPFIFPYRIAPYETRVLYDHRLLQHVEGFASLASERWKILGEFPIKKTDAQGNVICNANEPLLKRDREGIVRDNDLYTNTPEGACGLLSPDTSFLTRLPANTTFMVQGIDQNGMTLFAEQTWRHVAPGEVRTDCGGCHGHSIPAVDWLGTEASQPSYVEWDLARRTPYVTRDAANQPVTAFRTDLSGADVGMWEVEYERDIRPILEAKCVACHGAIPNPSGTDFRVDDPIDPLYWRLTHDALGLYGGPIPGGERQYFIPQMSKYLRAFQSRQSLLMWKIFGGRLDGRSNAERADDWDYVGGPMPPPGAPQLSDEEKRLISRWVDLGAPADLPAPPVGFSMRTRNRYTDDAFLPVLTVAEPRRGSNPPGWNTVVLGLFDSESGIDPATLSVVLDMDLPGHLAGTNLASLATWNGDRTIATIVLPGFTPVANADITLSVSVADRAGNGNRERIVFSRP